MNAHLHEALGPFAEKSGSVAPCSDCQTYDVYQYDDEADRRAYAMATNAWKAGEFPRLSLAEVTDGMKAVLADVNVSCPGCRKED